MIHFAFEDGMNAGDAAHANAFTQVAFAAYGRVLAVWEGPLR